MHRQVTGKHKFTRITTTWTWGESHCLPPYSILYAWPWGQHPNVIFSRDSQVGIPKISNLGFLRLWRPIILCVDLRLKWGLKQSYSPHHEISNGMWHDTFTQGSHGDSWLLVIASQIDNLTFDPSFGHNLCFNYPNGSCEPILNIYVLRASNDIMNIFFQWVLTLAITFWKFESVKVHSLTLSHIPKSMECDSRASLLAHTFVNLCFGCELKFKVAT